MRREQYFRLGQNLDSRFGFPNHGDAEVWIHELAHFLLIFGRKPKSAQDWGDMQVRLNSMTNGRSQIHEIRTLALERAVCPKFGLRFNVKKEVDSQWDGVYSAGFQDDHGKCVVKTKRQMKQMLMKTKPSKRNVRLLTSMIKECLQ